MAVGEWAVRWMFTEPEPRNVDPVTLTWWMSRRLVPDEVPDDRTVVQFDYAGERPTRIWIVLERKDASVCTEPPGFDSDVVVSTDPVGADAGLLRHHVVRRRAGVRRHQPGRPAEAHPGAADVVRLESLRAGDEGAAGTGLRNE